MLKPCISAALAAALLAACSVVADRSAPAPNPIVPEPRVVAELHGSGSVQGFVGVQPVTALFQWSGNGRAEYRAFGPTYLYLSGDSTFTVTPTPGLEAEAIRSVDTRAVVVIREGINVGLRAPMPMPKPAPPPEPIKSPEPVACADGSCGVPSH